MLSAKLLTLLAEFGLSDLEAQVYLGALSRGPSTVAELALASNVKRTTVYPVLRSLEQKGLVTKKLGMGKDSYVPTSPEHLRVQLVDRAKRLEERLPQLVELYQTHGIERGVQIFETHETVKAAYEELLSRVVSGEFYYVISDIARWERIDPHYFQSFIERRTRKGLEVRFILAPSTSTTKNSISRIQATNAVRFLPKSFALDANMAITPRRLLLHQMADGNFAMLVSNRAFIQLQKQMFEMLWHQLS